MTNDPSVARPNKDDLIKCFEAYIETHPEKELVAESLNKVMAVLEDTQSVSSLLNFLSTYAAFRPSFLKMFWMMAVLNVPSAKEFEQYLNKQK